MTWKEVCADQSLQDLPFKVELNQWGQIVMSPADLQHSSFQGEIIRLLNIHMTTGRTIPECAIETAQKTKVPDVAWISDERFQGIRGKASCPVAPEICVEILSPFNPRAEMLGTLEQPGKRELYFQAGAQEFWLCNEKGKMSFFNPAGPLAHSTLCPDFPKSLSWFA